MTEKPVKDLTNLELASKLADALTSIDSAIGDPIHPRHRHETYIELAVKIIPYVDGPRINELLEELDDREDRANEYLRGY